jgi:hypothetical protein
MYKRHILAALFLWFFSVFACLGVMVKYSPQAEEEYHRLISQSDQAKNERIDKNSLPSEQKRYEVTKQILFTRDGKRVHSRLSSEKSELILNRDGKREMVENLTGLKGTLEENIKKDQTFKANQGFFSFNRQFELKGDIRIQHEIGEILAEKISSIPEQQKKDPFSSLEFSGNVAISLNEGGKLECQQGKVVTKEMRGFFYGNQEFPLVVYKGAIKDPIEVNGKIMKCCLIRENGSDSKIVLGQIEVADQVRVIFNSDHDLSSDHALYDKGLLTLWAADQERCRMSNRKGDSLQAKKIEFDTVEKKLHLYHPEGKLLIDPLQIVKFKADELFWDQNEQSLLLKGAVDLLHNSNLSIRTDREISLVQNNRESKRKIQTITSPEKTDISYMDPLDGNMHHIFSPGLIQIDHEKQEMAFQGIAKQPGMDLEKSQVFIEDAMGEMYADSLKVFYQEEDNKIHPQQIILEGNVRLIRRFDGHMDETVSVLHYALADRIDYFPKKKEMVLSSQEGNRALLVDKVNNVQMSAPAFTIQRNQELKKDVIKGIGDVRLTFLEKEFAQLKERFKNQEKKQDGK